MESVCKSLWQVLIIANTYFMPKTYARLIVVIMLCRTAGSIVMCCVCPIQIHPSNGHGCTSDFNWNLDWNGGFMSSCENRWSSSFIDQRLSLGFCLMLIKSTSSHLDRWYASMDSVGLEGVARRKNENFLENNFSSS